MPGLETDVGLTFSFLACAETDRKNDMQTILLTVLQVRCFWFTCDFKKDEVSARILLIGAVMWSIVLGGGTQEAGM